MPAFRARFLVLSLGLCLGSVYAQSQQIAVVNSSYPLTTKTLGATAFFSISLGVSYPTGLAPGSYISGTQLSGDFQTFNASYPNPQDPPEAILSTIVAAILAKYPQMTGASSSALLGTALAPGVNGPSGGVVSVTIGTNSLLSGVLSARIPSAVKPKTAGTQ